VETHYDGVIIGAGHHGLILGAYLARAGLRIALVERRLMYGGGLATVEATLPGFYHNSHSINHFHITHTPWFRDLGLGETVDYVTPEYEFGQPHGDGTALVFSRDLESTLASVARFSKRDAATFRDWNRRAEAITRDIFLVERFSEPLPAAEREALLSRTALGRDFLEVTRHEPFALVDRLFEHERIKLLFLFKVSLFGTWLVDTMNKTSPMGSVIRAFDLETGYQLCRGGSFNLARGLMERFIAAGGRFINHAHVERIVLEGGRATGITLADGRTLRAGQFVASTVDVHQTFADMIGRPQLPASYAAKLDAFKYTAWTLFGVHFALAESPRFKASAFDANLDRALKWNVGAESIADLVSAHEDVKNGRVPGIVQFGSGALSRNDPAQAPAGKHTTYAWHVMPQRFVDRDPETFEREFTERIVERFAHYAPNMNRANILKTYTYTARQYGQELINMRSGDIFMGAFSADQVMDQHWGYRTPVERLYMAGSACHPGGAISGGAGYISAGVIARDLGLKPWWTPVDARTAFERLHEASAPSRRPLEMRPAAAPQGESRG
jgi:phytoene dehydrogenase-like protein